MIKEPRRTTWIYNNIYNGFVYLLHYCGEGQPPRNNDFFYSHVRLYICLFFVVFVAFDCFGKLTYHPFSVSDSTQVYFSPGSLEFNAMLGTHRCADGKIKKGTWRFAERQWHLVGDSVWGNVYYNGEKCDNAKIAEEYNGWIDMFGWATSGWDNTANDPAAIYYEPWLVQGDWTTLGYGPSYSMPDKNLTGTSRYYDWGQYNEIQNGYRIDTPETWRLFTWEEWIYLINWDGKHMDRDNYYSRGRIITRDNDTVNGLILLPDDWETPEGITFVSYDNERDDGDEIYMWSRNSYSEEEWNKMEERGAIFLNTNTRKDYHLNYQSDYWSSTAYFNPVYPEYYGTGALGISFQETIGRVHASRTYRLGVRLVRDVHVQPVHLCQSDSFLLNGKTYKETGVYTDTLKNIHGIDSIVIFDITVAPTYKGDTNTVSACSGEKYIWNGKQYNKSGIYTDTLQTIAGCDSIVCLNLTFYDSYYINRQIGICKGDSVVIGNKIHKEEGHYIDTLTSVHGCDSIINVRIQFIHSYPTTYFNFLCHGDSIAWNDTIYKETGIYTDSFKNIYGCDSIVILDLTVYPAYQKDSAVTICEGEKIIWHDRIISTTGIYTDSFTTLNGCDSIVILDLTVAPAYHKDTAVTICEGEKIVWHDRIISTTGIYTDSFTTLDGCDSIVILDLTIYPAYYKDTAVTICEREKIVWNGKVYQETGVYIDSFQTAHGCDSILSVKISVYPTYHDTVYATIYSDETYTWHNQTYNTTGIYADSQYSVFGCDSITYLSLTVIPTTDYLTFTAEEKEASVTLTYNGSPGTVALEYSLNHTTWHTYTMNDTILLSNIGSAVAFRAKEPNNTFSQSINDYYHFVVYKSVKATGNIMSLLGRQSDQKTVPPYTFYKLFSGCTSLTQAPELPALQLGDRCYEYMFYRCVGITQSPALPATELAEGCYYNMFSGCYSLTVPPVLPAMELRPNCYGGMFNGCLTLSRAPELSATILSEGCYAYMFHGCRSLTEAPILPATELAPACYAYMFSGCERLAEAPALPSLTMTARCYEGMLEHCLQIERAPELPSMHLAEYCYRGMFMGCTRLTQSPTLPATILAEGCYEQMFELCTSLTFSPELPAEELTDNSYKRMFARCSNLNRVEVSFTDYASDRLSTYDWLDVVSSRGVFVCPSGLAIVRGSSYIPIGWIVEYNDNSGTSLREIEPSGIEDGVRVVIEDGRVVILRHGRKYDVLGNVIR